MNKKKVLIITYYWPPSGGSGVQRWVKFVKYLRNFGWEPILYTPSNPELFDIDESLINDLPPDLEVLKTPIWEPYLLYKKFVGLKQNTQLKTGMIHKSANQSITEKFSIWVRGNFFIPDARKFWIKSSVKFLTYYLTNNSVHAIVSNGPPHSLHLIALKLKNKLNIAWLADFRDPWTDIDFYDHLQLTSWADKKHHRLEKKVLSNADKITVATPGMKRDFLVDYPQLNLDVITNGFDKDDFKNVKKVQEEKFVLAHIGVLIPSRNHPFFWDVIKELVEEYSEFSKHFCFRSIGNIDQSIIAEIQKRELLPFIEIINYIPHKEVITELKKAWVLILKIRNSQNQLSTLPGKLLEYFASRRPIISIGPPNSDSAVAIAECGAGRTFQIEHKEQLKQEILRYFNDFLKGKKHTINNKHLNKYSRFELTRKLADCLNEIS